MKPTRNHEVKHLFATVAGETWLPSLLRQVRELWHEWRHPRPKIELTSQPDPTVLGVLMKRQTPFASFVEQVRELYEEHENPRPKLQLTAKADPHALANLVEGRTSFASLYYQGKSIVHDLAHPTRIETTAEPVEVPEVWSKPKMGLPGGASLAAHALVIALLMLPFGGAVPAEPKATETFVMLNMPDRLILNLPPEDEQAGGGGGGGKRDPDPPSLGELPRPAEKQLVPPSAELPKNPDPILVAEPTIIASVLPELPNVVLPRFGVPAGLPGPPSSGPGVGGGIGTGQGRGVGEGKGPGFGPGESGGAGGGVYRVGGGITPPTIVYRVEPQYSEEARKARYQGTVVLEAIVRSDGSIDILRIVRSLGFGLDENAIIALKQWKFRPGMKNGQAVDVALNIEINFNLR